MEQAEVGQSPTLLALRYRYGGLTYTPGISCGPRTTGKAEKAISQLISISENEHKRQL